MNVADIWRLEYSSARYLHRMFPDLVDPVEYAAWRLRKAFGAVFPRALRPAFGPVSTATCQFYDADGRDVHGDARRWIFRVGDPVAVVAGDGGAGGGDDPTLEAIKGDTDAILATLNRVFK